MGFLTLNPFAFALVIAGSVLQVDSLKCYQCQNCNTVSSEQLLTCNITLPIPPTDPPATDPPAPATDPTAPTTDPPAPATDPTAPATDPPAPTTDPTAPATDPPAPATDPMPPATDPPAPATDPPAPATDPPAPATDPPAPATDPPAPATDPPAPATDPPAPATDPPAPATDPPAPATDPPAAATDPPSAETDPPIQTDAPNPEEFKVSRVKRSINLDEKLEEGLFDDDCFCQNEYCNCGGRIFFSSYDDIKAVNITLVCVTDTVTNNGTTIINRGCGIKANTTEETCSLSGYSQNCKPCETDGCNSLAISLQFSSLLLIPVFLALFVK